MFEKLPSLRGFQPKFYSGGPRDFICRCSTIWWPARGPKSIVTLGIRRRAGLLHLLPGGARTEASIANASPFAGSAPGESEEDDVAWRKGKDYGEEFYGDRVRFFASGDAALAEVADGSVDLLLLDDCDSGTEIRADLSTWESKLAPEALVLLHGIALEREDSPEGGAGMNGLRGGLRQFVPGRDWASAVAPAIGNELPSSISFEAACSDGRES